MSNYFRCIIIVFLIFDMTKSEEFLIVSHSQLIDNSWYQPLEELHNGLGNNVSLISIADYVNVQDIASQISTHQPSPDFVLLVGDANNQPDIWKEVAWSYDGNYMPFGYEEMEVFLGFGGFDTLDIASDKVIKDELESAGINCLLGRVPAESIQEMVNWVNKLVDYYSFNQYAQYRNRILIVTDNKNHPTNGGSEWGATRDRDRVLEYLNDTDYEIVQLNSNEYTGGYYENISVRATNFESTVNSNLSLIYTHGSGASESWLNNFYWDSNDEGNTPNWNFTNQGNYPFLWGYSCDIGRIQKSDQNNYYQETPSILEKLLFLENAGIVGAIAPTAITFSPTLDTLYSALWERYVHGNYADFYTLTEDAKQDMLDSFAEYAMERTYGTREWEHRSYVFYGDPSIPISTNQFYNSNILENAVWKGSIVVEQPISLTSGNTITIKPGTGVFFKPGARLVVESGAVLNAIGTEAFPIVFVPATEDNYQAGYWSGIASESEGEVNLTYCKVKGAVTGLSATKSTGTIASSEFSKNKIGITLNYANGFSINHCLITDNHTGVQLLYSSPGVAKNTITNNTHYGLYAFRSKSKMANNTFEHNGIYGLKIANKSMPILTAVHPSNNPQVNNVFESNDSASIWIDLTSRPDLGRYMGINGQIYGGFNQFKNRGRDVDILNNAETVSANVNWWENMNIAGQGSIDTEPTADQLFGPPARTMASQSDSLPPALGQAYSLELEGNYTDAVTLYETVLAEAPDGDYAVEALYGIIRCYSELNDMITLDNTLLNYYTTYSGLQVGITSYDYSITINTQLQQYSEALNRSIDLLDKVAGTEDEAHVLLEQGILYSFMAGDSTGSGQKQVSPGSAQRLALATYETVLDNYSETSSAEIAAWFLGKTYVSSRSEELDASVPNKFALYQNYPNPFNPNTTIRYDLPEQSIVSLTIYDILGREVKTLVNGARVMGKHTAIWDGKDRFGIPVSTGMYIYRITAVSKESEKHFVQNHKMVLMK